MDAPVKGESVGEAGQCIEDDPGRKPTGGVTMDAKESAEPYAIGKLALPGRVGAG
jgi:hypothetical protein